MSPRFQFSNVVVVETSLVGCILKTWERPSGGYEYEVYVRSWNAIKQYAEEEIKHLVYDKELLDD